MTVCLCMIVKDEAPVIRRCLDSVRPLIDAWLIVDTGSSDGTQSIVREHLAGLPGDLVERPWVDFAHNRTEALALARERADYLLVIDADDVLDVPPGYALPALAADSYWLTVDFAGLRYTRPHLIRSAVPWRYEGVVHEYLTRDGAGPAGALPLTMRIGNDGHRRRDPDKYRKDAALLGAALETEADPLRRSRYAFYLAQSYRDAGDPERALALYALRAAMGGWAEEVFVAWLNAGRLALALGRPAEDALALFARASAAAPARAEALHDAARLLRRLDRFTEAADLARRAAALPLPADGLFVEAWIYDYGARDEFAVSGYWAGHHRESLAACLDVLAHGGLPEGDRARAAANARFALAAMV